MKFLLAILLLGVASLAAAQGVPKINIELSCRAAAKGSVGFTQTFDSCRKSGEAARNVLVKQWKNFPAADRDTCYRLTTTGTPGTYTELLTCLEIRRDVRKLPKPKPTKAKKRKRTNSTR